MKNTVNIIENWFAPNYPTNINQIYNPVASVHKHEMDAFRIGVRVARIWFKNSRPISTEIFGSCWVSVPIGFPGFENLNRIRSCFNWRKVPGLGASKLIRFGLGLSFEKKNVDRHIFKLEFYKKFLFKNIEFTRKLELSVIDKICVIVLERVTDKSL